MAMLAMAAARWHCAASTLLVYNNNDNGAGSLRQAIVDNHVLGGGNTIVFSNVVSGTITLTSGELLIGDNVTILGPGPSVLTVDGNYPNTTNSVFHINTNSVVLIAGLTITNAGSGGIYNEMATLTVSNCTISGNTAFLGGGILNDAGESSATLTVIASTLNNNSAIAGGFGGGGAIYNEGFFGSATVTVKDSTLNGNTASGGGTGGGIYNLGYFGSATLTVIASTLSSNSAYYGGLNGLGGGAIYNWGASTAVVTVVSSTLNGNSADSSGAGGIYNVSGISATVQIGDTILKAGVSGANLVNNSGTITSLGYNISSDSGGGFPGFLTASGDRILTDPMLGPLQDNGGPTPTCAPLPGSPAIDQGRNLSGPTTDQRGRYRTYDDPNIPNATGGDGTDIGAVEVSPAHGIVGTNNDNSGASLRWCINDAQPGDTITFAPAVSGRIKLTSGELVVGNNLTILGPGAKVLAVDGNGSNRVFHITGGSVAISGLTITNGSAINANGGGILNYGTLRLSNCSIVGNVASTWGGGIQNQGVLSAWNCAIAQNVAFNTNVFFAAAGGGINNASSATLVNCTIANNNATATNGTVSSGGGISSGTGLFLTNCTVAGNNSSYVGGGIYNNAFTAGAVTITGSIVASNTAAATSPDVGSFAAFASGGYNLIGKTNGSSGFINGINQDQVGSVASPLDPLLGPLQDNGGPTPSMALLLGSPAIDQGKSFGLTTDQRGEPRPFDWPSISNATGGDGSDIGAFERGRPKLNIQQIGSNAVLSWASYYGITEFSLQSSTNIASSNSWINAGGSPVVVGTQYQQTNSPISGSKFFRLKSN